MCPVIDKEAAFLQSTIGENYLKKVSDTPAIWTAQADEENRDDLNQKVASLLDLIFDEFPYALFTPAKSSADWKAMNDTAFIKSRNSTGQDVLNACLDANNTIYVADGPYGIPLNITAPKAIAGFMTDNNIAFVIVIDSELRKFYFGFNPDSKLLKSHNVWKDSYLTEIYQEFSNYLGAWFEGISRKHFQDDSEIAYFISHGTTAKFRDKFITQSERLLSELPFPTDQVAKIANKNFSSDEKAKEWVKNIRHEFQLRSSYEEDALAVIRAANNLTRDAQKEFTRHGYEISENMNVISSTNRPAEISIQIQISNKDNSSPESIAKVLDFSLMEDGDIRGVDEVEKEIESVLTDWLDKKPIIQSRRFPVALLAIGILALVIVVLMLDRIF